MTINNLPNIISVFRLCLVLPITWVLLEKNYNVALILFFIAGFSDALDGFLAKKFDWSSKLGTMLDPMADKILLNVCYLTLSYLTLIPWWLTAVIFLRDLILTVIGLHYYFHDVNFKIQPTMLSKLNTFLQILLVFGIILIESLAIEFSMSWLVILVLISTLTTSAHYFILWKFAVDDTVTP